MPVSITILHCYSIYFQSVVLNCAKLCYLPIQPSWLHIWSYLLASCVRCWWTCPLTGWNQPTSNNFCFTHPTQGRWRSTKSTDRIPVNWVSRTSLSCRYSFMTAMFLQVLPLISWKRLIVPVLNLDLASLAICFLCMPSFRCCRCQSTRLACRAFFSSVLCRKRQRSWEERTSVSTRLRWSWRRARSWQRYWR